MRQPLSRVQYYILKRIFKLVRPSQKRYRNLVTIGNSLLTGTSKDQAILSSVIVMKLPIVS